MENRPVWIWLHVGLLVKYTLTQDYWMALEAEHGISNTLNKIFFLSLYNKRYMFTA